MTGWCRCAAIATIRICCRAGKTRPAYRHGNDGSGADPDVLGGRDPRGALANDSYRLVGHKWFYTVPASDAHSLTAQARRIILFLCAPRFLPDGQRNSVRLERLKDKLGNRSNASASRVSGMPSAGGTEGGRRDSAYLRWSGMTRLDCALRSHGNAARIFQSRFTAMLISVELW